MYFLKNFVQFGYAPAPSVTHQKDVFIQSVKDVGILNVWTKF
jgi:hypothetical protein